MPKNGKRYEDDFEPEKLKSQFIPSQIAWWIMFILEVIQAIASLGEWLFPMR